MKKFYIEGIFFLAFFSFIALPTHNSIAEEIDGVEGNSYLTFIAMDHCFNLDIFTFGTDGTFDMKRKEGTGTYEYHAPIFEAKWMSVDGNTTYNFIGLSLVSLVIIGWEDEMICTACGDDCGCIFFVGIDSELFPD